MLRFLLLQVITPHYHQDQALRDMAELEQLVATYQGTVVEKSVQHRVKPHPHTYIGVGKVEWVKDIVKTKKIDVVVLNAIVKAGQIFRLEKELWSVNTKIEVWDRVDLILNIFDKHATTVEAKLQIELAKIEHLGPRMYGLGGTVLSRQGAGPTARGAGETNIEFERRKIKKIKQKIQEQLQQRAKVKQSRIQWRQEKGMRTVALVGYTSAGKTTLFNALTNKRKRMSRALFTTLDSAVGKLKISPHDPTILVSDTIGFIDQLPPFLVEAFRSTLLEAIEAQVILHVIDAADPNLPDKIDAVEKILGELRTDQEVILVFNKVDLISEAKRQKLTALYGDRPHFFISAKTDQGLDELKQSLFEKVIGPIQERIYGTPALAAA